MVQIVAVTPPNNLQKVFSLWLINLRGYHYSNTAADCRKWPLLCNHHYESVYILWSYWRRLQIVSDWLQCAAVLQAENWVHTASTRRLLPGPEQTQGQHSTLLRIKQERNMTRRQRQNIEELENCLDFPILDELSWYTNVLKWKDDSHHF